ncbi:hypothetical protein ACFVGM_33410 [Kitasatospora purpeofusca]|uniref:hypothetical protein n=1 Tax=Kitasatospora purpeofusca TaxID=67352 RepID=UPI00369D6C56
MAAALCAAPAMFWGVQAFDSLIGMPLILGSLSAAVPLLARDSTDFRPACLVFGCGLLALPLLGVLFGMVTLMLVPAGIVLLAAASCTRPEPGRLPLLIGTLVSAVTLGFAGWTIGIPWIAR